MRRWRENVAEPEQVEIDYEKMTADELDAELSRTGGVIQDEPVEAAPEPVPEPTPEPVAEEVAAVEDSPSVEEPSTPTEELDDRDLQIEEMRLKMERMEQGRQATDYSNSRNAGEVGFLKKELERLRTAPPPQSNTDLDYPVEAQTRPQQSAPSHLEGQVAELRAEQTASAVERVYSEFLTTVESDLKAQGVEQDKLAEQQNSIIEAITPTLKERFEPFGDVSTLGAKSLQKVTRMVLQGAYTDHRLAQVAALRSELSERKATQIADSKIVKQAASPSGSGGTAVKESPLKRPEDMTAEEADAALVAEHGERLGNLRERSR